MDTEQSTPKIDAKKITTGISIAAVAACCLLSWQSCTVKAENTNLKQLTTHQAATIDSAGHVMANNAVKMAQDSITILHYHTCFNQLQAAQLNYITVTTSIFNACKQPD